MWEYWHFGKYHRQGDGEGFKTQPWKTLNVNMLENTNTQKGYINNLRFLCKKFDEAYKIDSSQTPSESELVNHFKSPAVQDLLKLLEVTATGRKSRVLQCHWEYTA